MNQHYTEIIKKQKPYLKDISVSQYVKSIERLSQNLNGTRG